MWLNKYEEQTIGTFMEYIIKNERSKFVFELNDGAAVKVILYAREFESDNGLDLHDQGYEEYWEMSFEIIDVIKDDMNKYSIGQKFCINYHCVPNSYRVCE